jgi:hypothetical protein
MHRPGWHPKEAQPTRKGRNPDPRLGLELDDVLRCDEVCPVAFIRLTSGHRNADEEACPDWNLLSPALDCSPAIDEGNGLRVRVVQRHNRITDGAWLGDHHLDVPMGLRITVIGEPMIPTLTQLADYVQRVVYAFSILP